MESRNNTWNADDYAKNSSAQLGWAEELLAKLALKGNESVLDIGCGDGKITARIAQRVKDGYVFGIDSSANMIQHACKQFPVTEYPNLFFRHMDATQIHLLEKFDLAFSNATLHWVKEQNAVLSGVHRCVRSGGKLLFQMGGQGNAAEIFTTLQGIIDHPRWQRYFQAFKPPYHFYGPEEYKRWLVQNGFRPVRVELLLKDMQHKGAEGVKGWLRTTWFPYTDRLPVELREIFLEEIVERYAAIHPIDSMGNTHINMVRLEVEAYAL